MSGNELKQGVDIKTGTRRKTAKPSLFRVVLLNDDYTTMDFVVYVLERVFHKMAPEAVRIMLSVHKSGAGLAGVYTREIAETKIEQVHTLAREKEFPLKCIMERE